MTDSNTSPGIVHSRAAYMAGDVDHDTYYRQFTTQSDRDCVAIAIGHDRLRASTDPHLNDIPLCVWDRLYILAPVDRRLRDAGDVPSLAGRVCVWKAAARAWLADNAPAADTVREESAEYSADTVRAAMAKRSYRFFSDPSHGWLRVPMADIVALRLENIITRYSYARDVIVFLEEDCDASEFVAAYVAEFGHGPTITEAPPANNPSRIRRYPQYSRGNAMLNIELRRQRGRVDTVRESANAYSIPRLSDYGRFTRACMSVNQLHRRTGKRRRATAAAHKLTRFAKSHPQSAVLLAELSVQLPWFAKRSSLPVFETRLAKIREGSGRYATAITSTRVACDTLPGLLHDYFADRLDCEEFAIVTLDTKHKPTGMVRVTRGTLDASLVHPREVFRAAIAASASAIILVHNHPSGDPTPSREDKEVTVKMTECGRMLGIDVLDHIVIAGDRAVSVREVA